MDISAIIMMIIGCGGLWGGFAVSCYIAAKRGGNVKDPNNAEDDMKN